LNDTLVASFIGYEKQLILISDPSDVKIALKPFSINISTIEITGESDLLYLLVARSKKTKAYNTKEAKSYLFLESSIEGKTTEMIEAYYNGSFKGYDLKKLELKNGRIGLQNYNGQYFINMQSSRAIMMHELFVDDDYFPKSPVGLSKRKLKKTYQLDYQNRFQDGDRKIIYEIGFEPRKENRSYFEGTIWIDSLSANIQKIELKAKDCIHHPFLPLYPDDKIERIDLFVRKTFVEKEGSSYPREIDFDYRMEYRKRDNRIASIKTNSLLYIFDYESLFHIPYFDFPEDLDNDYRKINALPSNPIFWQYKPFQYKDEDGTIDAFFNSDSTLNARNIVYSNGIRRERKSFFEHPYIAWNGKRIRMKDMQRIGKSKSSEFSAIPGHSMSMETTIDKYNFEVQLFLDIYPLGDSLYYTTAAVFDPFESYYYYEQDAKSAVFMNIYFDLGEIYNRKLTLALKGIKDPDKAIRVYHQIEDEFEQLSKDYFFDVNRGENRSALESYNELVRTELGIDNIKIFRLEDEDR
jgi:hypothetical protein